MGATRKAPSYRLHAPTRMAVVTLTDPASGRARDHYLGYYGTAESRRKYDRLIAAWLSSLAGAGRSTVERPAVR